MEKKFESNQSKYEYQREVFHRIISPQPNVIAIEGGPCSGKQHLGEDFEAHAKRELCEKTGLKLDLTFRGTANIIIRENQEVLTHVVAHIHSGISKEIILPPDNDMFNFHLYEQGNKTNAIMPGTSEILKLLETTKSIFVTNLDLN